MSAELTVSDWPPISAEDIERIAPRFASLEGAVRILWHSPRPYSAAARVRTAQGEFFIKRHDARVRDLASLGEEHRYMAYLRNRSIAVPELIPDRAGATALAQGNWTFEVHAPAAGVDAYRDAHSWTPAQSETHAFAMGRALAHVHLASVGYDAPARQPRPLLACFDIIGAQDLAPALEHFVMQRPAVAQFLAASGGLDPILHAVGPLHAALRPLLPALDALWVHNDWHASNLFWTDRGADAQVRAVIDFGLCNRGCAVADLATALERNTIAWLDLDRPAAAPGGAMAGVRSRLRNAGEQTGAAVGPATIGRPALALALLDGYCAVRLLSAAERRALPLLMSLAHVEYALSEVDYFHGVIRNDEHARLAYPKFLLRHVQWFAGRQGREYLGELRQWLRIASHTS